MIKTRKGIKRKPNTHIHGEIASKAEEAAIQRPLCAHGPDTSKELEGGQCHYRGVSEGVKVKRGIQ